MTAPYLDLYWREVLKGVESNELDIPLAAIYSFEYENATVAYQGGLGIPEHHPLAINAELQEADRPLVPLFRKATEINSPMVLQHDDVCIPAGMLEGVRWRGFGEPSKVLAILPLAAGENIGGFFLIGLNPRRAYDDDYDGFIQLLSRQLSTSLTSAVLMDQAKRKQAELSKDLAEGEIRFKAMTELNTAG